jgi:chemotaxis protein MotB
MLMGGAAFYAKQQKLELEKTRAQMEELRKTSEETGAQAERLLKGLEESKERIEKLVEEKEAATKAQKDLESQMRSALESKDVTISELQGKLTVNILDRILFDSGEAILKPEGQAVQIRALQTVPGVLWDRGHQLTQQVRALEAQAVQAEARLVAAVVL